MTPDITAKDIEQFMALNSLPQAAPIKLDPPMLDLLCRLALIGLADTKLTPIIMELKLNNYKLSTALGTLILHASGKQRVLELIGEEGDTGSAANAKRFKREIEEAQGVLTMYGSKP